MTALVHLVGKGAQFECCGHNYSIRREPGHEGDMWTMDPNRCTCLPLGAVERVQRFLDLNYPCTCTDADCPGNGPEAGEIVRLVLMRPDA